MKCDYSQNDLFDQLGGFVYPSPPIHSFFTIHDSQTIAEARSVHNMEPVVVLLQPDLGDPDSRCLFFVFVSNTHLPRIIVRESFLFQKPESRGLFLFVGIPATVAEGIDGGFELGFCVGGVDDGCKKTVLCVDDGLFCFVEPCDKRGSFPVFGLDDITRFPRDLMYFTRDVCLVDAGEVVVIGGADIGHDGDPGLRKFIPFPRPMSCIVFDPKPVLVELERALSAVEKELNKEWFSPDKKYNDLNFPYGPNITAYVFKRNLAFCRRRLNRIQSNPFSQ